MKKKNLSKLVVLGLAGTLISATPAPTPPDPKPAAPTQETPATPIKNPADKSAQQDPAYGNQGYHLMTEDELLLELSDEGTKTYNALDAEGKELARKVASQRCAASNYCAGLNACATAENTCAGKSTKCAGHGKCGFADKNLAVKVVSEKMAAKRAKLTK